MTATSYLYINEHYSVEQLTDKEQANLKEMGILLVDGSVPANYVVRNLATDVDEFYSSNLPTAMNAARSLSAGVAKEEAEYNGAAQNGVAGSGTTH